MADGCGSPVDHRSHQGMLSRGASDGRFTTAPTAPVSVRAEDVRRREQQQRAVEWLRQLNPHRG